jgi:hypothetical protein
LNVNAHDEQSFNRRKNRAPSEPERPLLCATVGFEPAQKCHESCTEINYSPCAVQNEARAITLFGAYTTKRNVYDFSSVERADAREKKVLGSGKKKKKKNTKIKTPYVIRQTPTGRARANTRGRKNFNYRSTILSTARRARKRYRSGATA